ncbi:23S rRNA pseudouridine(955/2504/2580) synthase RluC [Thalassotalea aquiviva]|uniref:23S rRNA pseudouridine(955/2504/2580) synthase RluC n=1 Tax=Thalassotalea aquiviva TaxID=3242415 RepID=UPI00352B0D76
MKEESPQNRSSQSAPSAVAEDRPKVKFFTVDEDHQGQRIDNYLLKTLKGVPKSMIYRLLRKGEIRVNKKRTKPEYKLQTDDVIRVAPIRVSEESAPVSTQLNIVSSLEKHILFEDDCLIVINKPSGMAVHGGSGLSFGLIEALRALRPKAKMLELVHRLDRDTSGCLMVAKKRSALRNLHEQLRNKNVQKFYHALVKGHWPNKLTRVTEGLRKNDLKSGERVVVVDNVNGKESETRYKVIQHYQGCTLVRAFPVTGRTHQIRVHCQVKGHPIACDSKYGAEDFTEEMNAKGLKRLFLHAASLEFTHPKTGERVSFEAPYDKFLASSLNKLVKKNH